MAEETHYASRSDNKRKFDDPASGPQSAAPPARRQTGFSAPIASDSPDNKSSAVAPPTSYNSVPPPVDGIQLAKQRAQEIAARLFSDAEAKRPKGENGGGPDDSSETGFSSAASDHSQKPLSQSLPSQVGMTPPSSFAAYGYQGSSKKIDIPNGRVGVIIGKGGETIRYLQLQSGAKIQVTRDMDADPYSQSRPVELVGTPEQISKAEQLITDVLAEADTGGSGTARKVGSQLGAEQFVMQVPNNKVGLVIGKGGETIKSMQAKSGARIQLIPLHPPPGDTSMERTVQIDGTSEQIEFAKQLVNEVISETRVRNPQMAGGYPQQGYRPPRPTTSWGPPGAPQVQQPGYGYMQPGAYPGAPPPYNMTQPPYGGYPPQPASGWDQSSNPSAQQTTPGSGYDYYNQQQQQQQQSSTPADNTSYNYGQQPANYNTQGSYGDSTYSQPAGGQQQQGYGQDGYYAPPQQPQSGYDQQGYGTTAYGANPAQDGSAQAYGAQGGPTQVTPGQQATPPAQPSATQQGYTAQQPTATAAGYSSQAAAPAGYGMPPPTSQPGYGGQPTGQTGYGQSAPLTQPSYGQPPQGQAQPAPAQTGYAHGQPPAAQSGYVQPGYEQQQSYGGVPSHNQLGYGQQQQQPYGDSYGGSGYSQPPAYSNDSSVHGAYDAAAATQVGVTKASPQS